MFYGEDNKTLELHDQCTLDEEKRGELQTIFLNGEFTKEITLSKIRENIDNNFYQK